MVCMRIGDLLDHGADLILPAEKLRAEVKKSIDEGVEEVDKGLKMKT